MNEDDALAWDRVEWRQGDGRYVFEVAHGGLHATMTTPQGTALTMPAVAWEALLDALAAARKTRSRTMPGDLPRRSGARWTAREVDELTAAFKSGATVEGLAQAHNRSSHAIEAQLHSQGLWDRQEGVPARGWRAPSRPMIPPDWPPDPASPGRAAPMGGRGRYAAGVQKGGDET